MLACWPTLPPVMPPRGIRERLAGVSTSEPLRQTL